jgi:hypothetical protein
MVVHACNPTYSEVEIGRITVQESHGKKASELPPSQQTRWVW